MSEKMLTCRINMQDFLAFKKACGKQEVSQILRKLMKEHTNKQLHKSSGK